jgi:hypothetical protein
VALSHNSSTESNAAITSDNAPAEAGMMAYIDPETGELTTGPRPAGVSVELDPDLQNALRRDDQGLEVVKHADGTWSMDLQGRYQHVSMVRIDENGNMTVCTDNAPAVEHNLSNKPVSAPNTLEVK